MKTQGYVVPHLKSYCYKKIEFYNSPNFFNTMHNEFSQINLTILKRFHCSWVHLLRWFLTSASGILTAHNLMIQGISTQPRSQSPLHSFLYTGHWMRLITWLAWKKLPQSRTSALLLCSSFQANRDFKRAQNHRWHTSTIRHFFKYGYLTWENLIHEFENHKNSKHDTSFLLRS